MAGKEVAGGVLRERKPFFSSIVGLGVREKRVLRTEKIKFCFATNALIVEPPTLKANLLDKGKG